MADRGATEKPTPKRLKKARKDGQVARTAELSTWLMVLTATYVLGHVVSSGSTLAPQLLHTSLGFIRTPDPARIGSLMHTAFFGIAKTIALPLAAFTGVAVACGVLQGGARPAMKLLKPQWKRLNPLSGIKRMFGVAGLWEAGKALVKVAVMGFMGWRSLQALMPMTAGSGALPLATVMGEAWQQIVAMMRAMAAVGLAFAAADYAFQRRKLRKQLMMTKQEVKDEMRQSEGDPHMRGAIRSRQMAMSRNRMMAAVKEADVILVNPTHIAVALKYEPGKGAPRVIAKGAGEIAARIRREATEHRVPVVQDVPLARGLYAACEVGQEIPAELYDAVARVLAFLFALRAKQRGAAADRSAPRRATSTHGRVLVRGAS